MSRHDRHRTPRPDALHTRRPMAAEEPALDPRVAGLLALQSGAGNAAVQRLLAGHRTLARYGAPTTNYDLGRAPGGADPFTLVSPDATVMPRTTPGAAGEGIGFARMTPAKPPILLSDDASLAVNAQAGEPKEFYAAPPVLQTANAGLQNAGSPLRLMQAGNTITPNGAAQSLEMVRPRLEGAAPPGANEFVNLTTAVCRDVAAKILGGNPNYAQVGTQRAQVSSADSDTVSGTHELAQALVAGHPTTGEAKTALETSRAAVPPRAGKDYGTALGRGSGVGGVEADARRLALNQFASARIGQAYLTQTIGNPLTEPQSKDFSTGNIQAFVWGYHFGAVVAESLDGADQITLENYNRSFDMREGRKDLLARLEADFAAQLAGWLVANPEPSVAALDEKAADVVRTRRIGEILHFLETGANASAQEARAAYDRMHNERMAATGKMWYFRLVGSANAAQTFHGQMAASGYFANPLTLATGHARTVSNVVFFEEGETEPTGPNLVIFQNVLNAVSQDLRLGRHMRFRVTGYASGGGWGTDARRQAQQDKTARKRADGVRSRLEAAGVDPSNIVTAMSYPDPNLPAIQKRRVDIALL